MRFCFDLAPETVTSLGVPTAEVEGHLRFLAAVKLFELKRAGIGTAAAVAGLDKMEFVTKLAALAASPTA